MTMWERLLIVVSGILALSSRSVVVLASETMPETARSLNVYSLFNLPPFAVTFTANAPKTSLLTVKNNFKAVTQTYLEDFFRASLLDTSTPLQKLHSINLKVSFREKGTRKLRHLQSNSVNLWAECYGQVTFEEPSNPTDVVSAEEAYELLEQLVAQAFDLQAIPLYQQRLRESDDSVLQTVRMLTIDTKYVPDSLERNNNNNGNEGPQTITVHKDWTTAEYVLLSLLILFLIISAATLFLLIRADRRKLRYGDSRPDYVDVARNLPSNTLQSSSHPELNGSGGEDVVPVVDEASGERRYVTPSSPLDLLYGASFLHQEYRRYIGRSKRSGVNTSSINHIKPMLQIDEAEEEHEDSSDSSSSDKGIGSWFRTLTSKMDCKKDEAVNQDFPFVYRDFPRHDGTPCLIFDKSSHSSDRQRKQSPRAPSISPLPSALDVSNISRDSLGSSRHSNLGSSRHSGLGSSRHSALGSSIHSASSHNSIDNFVDRLETLMRMKHKQYEERARMEQERQERRRQRELQRRERGPSTLALSPATPTSSTPSALVSMAAAMGAPTESVVLVSTPGSMPSPPLTSGGALPGTSVMMMSTTTTATTTATPANATASIVSESPPVSPPSEPLMTPVGTQEPILANTPVAEEKAASVADSDSLSKKSANLIPVSPTNVADTPTIAIRPPSEVEVNVAAEAGVLT